MSRHLATRPAVDWTVWDRAERDIAGIPNPRPSNSRPPSPGKLFAVLYRERIDAFSAEHGRQPTPEEHRLLKAQLRIDRPDLARPELVRPLNRKETTP